MARTPKVVEDRREQIIDAAMRVFAQKGFARATNKDIAKEAGITAGLIYHYFASKEDLLTTVVETHTPLQMLNTMPPQAFAMPPEQFFRFLMLQVLRIVEDEKFVNLIRVVLSELLHGDNPYFMQLMPTILGRALSFLSNYIEAKVAAGELRPVEDAAAVAQVMMGSMIGFLLRRQILHDPAVLIYTQEQVVEFIVNTTLQGLLPH